MKFDIGTESISIKLSKMLNLESVWGLVAV